MNNIDLVSNTKGLFLLYLIISGNFLAELFGCHLQKALASNMLLKHLFGIMTLYFFVMFTDTRLQKKPVKDQLVLLSVLYIWFIITTRTDYKYMIAVMITLFSLYVVNIKRNNEEEKLEENKDSLFDNANTDKIKKLVETLKLVERSLLIAAVGITGVGFFVYLGKKKDEYSGEWNWKDFFVGKPECSKGEQREENKSDIEYIKSGLSSIVTPAKSTYHSE